MHLTPAAREKAIRLLDHARSVEKNEVRGEMLETVEARIAKPNPST